MTRCASMLLLVLFALGGCKSVEGLLLEPKPDDPVDGMNGLERAGPSVNMDWGPGQANLLTEHIALKEQVKKLQDQVADLTRQNQIQAGQLGSETKTRENEQHLRQQSEAYTQTLQRRIRELESKVIMTMLEKTKLEQTILVSDIAKMQRRMEDVSMPAEAAAPAPGDR